MINTIVGLLTLIVSSKDTFTLSSKSKIKLFIFSLVPVLESETEPEKYITDFFALKQNVCLF